MPGSVKVSVLEAEHLPGTVQDGDVVSIRVSVGKREYQTKLNQAFGGRTPSWNYEFSYPVTNLRDNPVIAVVDSDEEVITKNEIQTTAIIQRGFWDGFFSFKGGSRLHLKLCFALGDEERKKVEVMRLEALRRKGLQNLLYRSTTYQMPKPAKSFVSGVTINEISSDSCLYAKGNENKENHGDNASSLRCPKLLEAPKEKNFLLEGPLQPKQHCKNPSDSPDMPNKNLTIPLILNVGEMPCMALESKHEEETMEKQAIVADSVVAAENGSLLLLPEASTFMSDLSSSGTVSAFEHPNSTNFTANMEFALMPENNVCIPSSEIQPNMKPTPDLAPFSNVPAALTPTHSPLPAENSVTDLDLKKVEDPSCIEAPAGAKTPGDVEMTETMQDAELASSEKLQAVEQSEYAAAKDVAEKLKVEKGTEDGRRTTSAVENVKILKNLPWKSQAKASSEKFEWILNKKRRTDNEHNVLAAENPQFTESSDSEKANIVNENEASNKNIYGWASAILQPNGRIKKLISVALLLAGVIILGCDAIQRDLASKKDSVLELGSIHAGKKGDKRHIITSSQVDVPHASSLCSR